MSIQDEVDRLQREYREAKQRETHSRTLDELREEQARQAEQERRKRIMAGYNSAIESIGNLRRLYGDDS